MKKAHLDFENRSEVILVRELRVALIKINSDCTANEINLAIEELTRDRSVMSAIAASKWGAEHRFH